MSTCNVPRCSSDRRDLVLKRTLMSGYIITTRHMRMRVLWLLLQELIVALIVSRYDVMHLRNLAVLIDELFELG